MTDSIERARAVYAMMGYGMDNTRSTWAQFGYPTNIEFEDYLGAYLRQPAAHALIERVLGKCWSTYPEICERAYGEEETEDKEATPWEKEVSKLFHDKKLRLWPAMREWDRMNMVGKYSALIMRIADGITDIKLPAKTGKLVEVIPCYESQIKVMEWDTDFLSPNYGMPKMYQFLSGAEYINNPEFNGPVKYESIHPSRVIVLGEGATGKKFWEGVPFLQPCYNRLIDLEKVTGGVSDSIKKNAARTLSIEYGKDTNPYDAIRAAYPDAKPTEVRDVLDDKAKDLNSGKDSVLVIQDGKLNMPQIDVIDPTGTWTIIANEIAASKRIPFTILFGQQTGRLASDQDQVDFANTVTDRRNNLLTLALENVVQWLIEHGCIGKPAQDFVIEWDDLLAPSAKDKLTNAKLMADTNKVCREAGDAPAFDANEIRVCGGYDARTDAEEQFILDDLIEAEQPPEETPPTDTAANSELIGIVAKLRAMFK